MSTQTLESMIAETESEYAMQAEYLERGPVYMQIAAQEDVVRLQQQLTRLRQSLAKQNGTSK